MGWGRRSFGTLNSSKIHILAATKSVKIHDKTPLNNAKVFYLILLQIYSRIKPISGNLNILKKHKRRNLSLYIGKL